MSSPSPPVDVMMDIIAMNDLIKKKESQLHANPTATENRAVNEQMKQRFDAMNDKPGVNALLARYNLQSYWPRFGNLIKSWMSRGHDAKDQAKELAELQREIYAAKGMEINPQTGEVMATSAEGLRNREFIGFGSGFCDRECLPPWM